MFVSISVICRQVCGGILLIIDWCRRKTAHRSRAVSGQVSWVREERRWATHEQQLNKQHSIMVLFQTCFKVIALIPHLISFPFLLKLFWIMVLSYSSRKQIETHRSMSSWGWMDWERVYLREIPKESIKIPWCKKKIF